MHADKSCRKVDKKTELPIVVLCMTRTTTKDTGYPLYFRCDVCTIANCSPTDKGDITPQVSRNHLYHLRSSRWDVRES